MRGLAAIAPLIAILEDEELALAETPVGGWPPIHAVDLLVDLRAVEAIDAVLRTLAATGWQDTLHDRILLRLHELGAAVVEPALALHGRSDDPDVKDALCAILSQTGVRDDRIYGIIRERFRADQTGAAVCFGDYGDARALPLLEQAVRDFEPDFRARFALIGLADLVEEHERLGGSLPEDLHAQVEALHAEAAKRRAAGLVRDAPVASTKIGRNDPCPCGSGRKYKRCCLLLA